MSSHKIVRDYSEIRFTRVPSQSKGKVKVQSQSITHLKSILKQQFRSYSRRQFLSKRWFLRKRAFMMRVRRTFEEARLWNNLSRYQLLRLKFKSQVVTGDYIADFVCDKVKLIIEVDGNHHYNDPEVVFNDRKRTQYLNGLEYTVLRFPNREIRYNLNWVLASLWNYCAAYSNQYHYTRYKGTDNPYHNKLDLFRLCDLVKLTGIPKSTIQYYRKMGLLYTEQEQTDRSKIPSEIIQHYTLEHLEKLKHIHSMRVKLEASSRDMLYLFRCIEESSLISQSPDPLTLEQIMSHLQKLEEKYFVAPKKPIKLKNSRYGLPWRDFASTLRPREHVYKEPNPYHNTPAGELVKINRHQQLMKTLGELFTQQQDLHPQSHRSRSPLGLLFERFMQLHYESPRFNISMFLGQ
jgi:very-short-patch-repair endonuclease/DNA-binding transcriptional MerR regulator